MVPIFIQMNTETKVNCIIQDSKQYCEQKDVSKKEVGVLALGLVGVFVWFALWFWISFKIDEKFDVFPLTIIIFGGIVLLLLVFGIISLL